MQGAWTDLNSFYHLQLCTHMTFTLYTPVPINMKVLPSEESQTRSNAFLLLFPEQFFFVSCHGCFSKPFPPNLFLWRFPSKFMPHSHSPRLPLVVGISNVLPSYFILTLPLIRPSISLVHSSLSLFFS